jgi:hypothetical protein
MRASRSSSHWRQSIESAELIRFPREAGRHRHPTNVHVPIVVGVRSALPRVRRVPLAWPVRDATAGFDCRVQDRNGKPLPIPIDLSTQSANTVSAEIPIAALAPGEYVVALIPRAKATTDRSYVAFRVTP